jgi:acylphosphatase
MTALRLVIRGRVQGVGFRFSLVDAAAGMGVTGWVRNRRDGTVEAFVQGDSIAVDAALAWCRRGPPSARVEGVDMYPSAADSSIVAFTSRPTA